MGPGTFTGERKERRIFKNWNPHHRPLYRHPIPLSSRRSCVYSPVHLETFQTFFELHMMVCTAAFLLHPNQHSALGRYIQGRKVSQGDCAVCTGLYLTIHWCEWNNPANSPLQLCVAGGRPVIVAHMSI